MRVLIIPVRETCDSDHCQDHWLVHRLRPRRGAAASVLRPLTGWSVTDLLPAGLSLESITGEGYTCTGATCVAAAPLAGGAQGPVPTVTAIIEDDVVGALTTIAWVTPAEGDVTETIPLVVPTSSTETEASATDHDAEAPAPSTSRSTPSTRPTRRILRTLRSRRRRPSRARRRRRACPPRWSSPASWR